MRIISVKMPEEMITTLDKIAKEHGVYRSEIIRAAITKYLLKPPQSTNKTQTRQEYYEEEVVVIN